MVNKMRTFIISNGDITDYEYSKGAINKGAYIICADGGARHAYNMGIKPDLIIGDLDSLNKQFVSYYQKQGVELIKHPKDKDKTDTHLCVLKAMEFSKDIVLLGALGSRFDHSFANISLLKLGIKHGIRIYIDDYHNQVHLLSESIKLQGEPGDTFSLLPLSNKVGGLTVSGAKYLLKNAEIKLSDTYGISNVFINKEVDIKIKNGLLIVIKSRD